MAAIDVDAPDIGVLQHAFYRPELYAQHTGEFSAWLSRWADRVKADGEPAASRSARMNSANPRYVLRNYLAQQAIDRAEQGDATLIDELLDTLRRPYTEQSGRDAFAARRPEWARNKAGCSMLSCSS